MQLFFRFLRTKRTELLIFLFFALLFLFSFFLYGLPLAAVLYPFALCLLTGAIVLSVQFAKEKKKHETMEELKRLSLSLLEQLPSPDSIAEEDYRELIFRVQEEFRRMSAEDSRRYSEMVEYYTVWAHQIKTPIAAMRLSLQSEDSPLSRRLSGDLLRIEQYVEMVLAFLRLDSSSTDYVFRELCIDEVLRPSLRRYAQEFIGRRLTLEYEAIGETVISDEKWLSFVIEQILSNALKYTKTGGIRIFMREGKKLCIADSGIGIAAEDLPRIFERGYTGCNGRLDRTASGIGLYLCRRICEKLGIGIFVESEVGKGTTVVLDLDQYRMQAE